MARGVYQQAQTISAFHLGWAIGQQYIGTNAAKLSFGVLSTTDTFCWLFVMVCQGRCTLLLGPPGSGKTTFLKVLGNRLRGCNRLKVREHYACRTIE